MGINDSLARIQLAIDGVISQFHNLKKTRKIDKPLVAIQSFTANGRGQLSVTVLITVKAVDNPQLYQLAELVVTSLQSVVQLDRGEFLSGTDGCYCQLTYNMIVNLYSDSHKPLQQLIGHSEILEIL